MSYVKEKNKEIKRKQLCRISRAEFLTEAGLHLKDYQANFLTSQAIFIPDSETSTLSPKNTE